MNTPAHVLIAAVATAKPDARARNIAMLAGALIPDVMMFVMVAWERWVNGLSAQQIFREAYYTPFWQEIFAVNNSAPLYGAALVAGLMLRIEWLWVFGLAALLHVAMDLPLHHDDGRPHFWPFSDWIYASPVSYWDPGHHGIAAGWVEAGLSVALAAVLLLRFRGALARVAIVAGLAVELLFSVGSHIIYGSGAL